MYDDVEFLNSNKTKDVGLWFYWRNLRALVSVINTQGDNLANMGNTC